MEIEFTRVGNYVTFINPNDGKPEYIVDDGAITKITTDIHRHYVRIFFKLIYKRIVACKWRTINTTTTRKCLIRD